MLRDAGGVPHCRDDPPWCECGDLKSPDFGRVFVWPAANGAVMLTYDRQGRRHAVTLTHDELDAEIVIHGRRFDVGRGEPLRRRV